MSDARHAVALFEAELGAGVSKTEITSYSETMLFPALEFWPPDIQAATRAAARSWMQANRGRCVLATACTCEHDGHGPVCRFILLHAEKAEGK